MMRLIKRLIALLIFAVIGLTLGATSVSGEGPKIGAWPNAPFAIPSDGFLGAEQDGGHTGVDIWSTKNDKQPYVSPPGNEVWLVYKGVFVGYMLDDHGRNNGLIFQHNIASSFSGRVPQLNVYTIYLHMADDSTDATYFTNLVVGKTYPMGTVIGRQGNRRFYGDNDPITHLHFCVSTQQACDKGLLPLTPYIGANYQDSSSSPNWGDPVIYNGPKSCPQGRFRVEYFNNTTLDGTPVYTTCQTPPIDKNWGTGGPGNGVNSDNFSARWLGWFNMSAATYHFTAGGDDGFRFSVDSSSNWLINEWSSHAYYERSADTQINAGLHLFVYEYWEGTGGAHAKVRWSPLPAAPTNLSATKTDPSKIRLTWNASSGATVYKVFRNTSNSSSGATQIGSGSKRSYDDWPSQGVTYWYWVKAGNSYGDSGFSNGDSGFRPVVVPAAPTNLAATKGTLTDHIRVTWNASSGATDYKVFRNTSNSSSTATEIGSGPNTSYDDWPTPFVTYYYWVKAGNSAGYSGFSSSSSGYWNIQPPTNLSATKGTLTDRIRITWNASNGANNYKVYRNTSNNSGGASLIGQGPNLSYDDWPIPFVTYYYWVKAGNGVGDSGFSNGDYGYWNIQPPSISVTKGSLSDRIRVTWNSANGASNYKVYRSMSNSSSSATLIGQGPNTSYDDWPSQGVAYYYWVKAGNSHGDSGFSNGDSGYYGVGIPTNLSATKGTLSDRIRITWNAALGANSYKVYRNNSNNSSGAALIGSGPNTSYDDWPTPFVTYYYWVKGSNGTTDSGVSNGDYGYWNIQAPANLSATKGTLSDRIRVSWDASNGANNYKVYRNTSNSSSGAVLIGQGPNTSYDDWPIPFVTYYYWVKAGNGVGDSGFSNGDYGYWNIQPPSISVTKGSLSDRIRVTWNSANGASNYKVYRNTSNNSGGASLIGQGQNTTYDDWPSQGVTYWYWVKAGNSYGDSSFSNGDYGYYGVAIPTNLSATKGSLGDRIRVNWNGSLGANNYKVYRNTSNNSGGASWIGQGGNTSYDDWPSPCTTYYYWVKGSNGTTDSAFSNGDYGYWNIQPPSISVTKGSLSDRIRVTWNSVNGANWYKVYRNTSNNSGGASLIGQGSNTSYDDWPSPGTTYWYWVKATNGGCESSFSNGDYGYWNIQPPHISVSKGLSDRIRITWNSVSGANWYKVYRNTSNNSGGAYLIGQGPNLSYDDWPSRGVYYWYWVRASNGSSDSTFSNGDYGYY